MDTFEEIMSSVADTPASVTDAAPEAAASEASETVLEGAAGGEFADILKEQPIEEPEIPEGGEEAAVAEGEAPEGDKPAEAGDDEITDEAIEQALANPKTSKWFKNAINFHKGKLTERESELSGYRVYGSTEELEKIKNFRDDIYGFEEKNGNLVSTLPRFAEKIAKEDPGKAIEMVNAFVALDSPLNQGKSIFDELLDQPEVQAVLKERFAPNVPDDDPNLSVVPKDKLEAFRRLSKELREDFRFMAEGARNALLAQAQKEIDDEKAQIAINEQAAAENLQKFNAAVEETTVKNFDTVTDEFYESLKQIPFSPDAKLNKFLQSTVYDKVLTVVTMGETYAGKRAAKDLEEFGLSIAPETAVLVKKLESDSRLLTIAGWKKNQAALDFYAAEIATTQKQLAARANEIAAAISKAVTDLAKTEGEEKNTLLDKTKTKSRPAIAGAGSGGGGGEKDDRDYSSLSFEEILSDE